MSDHDLEAGTEDLPDAEEGVRILLIEDDEDDADMVRELLAREPSSSAWTVDWCATPSEGLEAADSSRHHVALVDHYLGLATGLETIRQLESAHPNLPAILLTGSDERAVDVAAMEAGAVGYLCKWGLTGAILERNIRYAVEQARQRTLLNRLAQCDPLTGLLNRASFHERVEHALQRFERAKASTHIGLALVDLDGFKVLNDECGHDAGDAVLVAAGRRLRAAVRPYDAVGRLGGDEFVVLLEDLSDRAEAASVAKRLVEAIAHPFAVPGAVRTITASVGLALHPRCGDSPGQLMAVADRAMYEAKRQGKGRFEVVDHHSSGSTRAPQTVDDLRAALVSGTLDLAFQPQVELHSERVVGFEALLRFRGADAAGFDVGSFIAELERIGAIVELDRWVIRRSCLTGAPGPGRVSVNLSPISLLSPELLEGLPRADLGPSPVTLEVTEQARVDDSHGMERGLRALRERGFRIAIDDFGAGFSGVTRLLSLPLDVLKLDRSLASGIDTHPRQRSIVRSLVDFCLRESLDLIAEGVETRAEADTLEHVGVKVAQGFLFAPAMHPDEIVGWMKHRSVRRSA